MFLEQPSLQCSPTKCFDSTKGVALPCNASDKGLGAVARRSLHCVCKPCTNGARNSLCANRGRTPCCSLWTGEIPHLRIRETSNCGIGSHTIRSDCYESLHLAPKRLQRMLLRVQAYSVNLGYRKGSTM